MSAQYRMSDRRNSGSRRTQYILLILAVIIVFLVVYNQYRKKQQEKAVNVTETDTTTVTVEPAAEPSTTTAEPVQPAQPAAPVESTPAVQQTTAVQQPVVEQTAPQTPQPVDLDVSSPEAKALIKQALQDKLEGRVILARDRFNRALDMKLSDEVRLEVKKQMTQLAEKWLFDKTVYPGDTLTELRKVQSGERLAIIARAYKVPHECIERINGITNPERLQAGQVIKVVHGPFSAVLSKKNYTMDLYLQGMYVKTYKVGLGKEEHETPAGKWRASSGGKMIRPPWTDPDTGRNYQPNDPDYPLGSRWIGLEGLEGEAKGRTGFAIHGTKEPETIGTRSSRGCIRLFNGDVVEVYDLMEAGVSEVLVVE